MKRTPKFYTAILTKKKREPHLIVFVQLSKNKIRIVSDGWDPNLEGKTFYMNDLELYQVSELDDEYVINMMVPYEYRREIAKWRCTY